MRLKKKTVTETKSTLHEFISRKDTIEDRIPELEDMTTEASKTDKGRKQSLK